MFTSIAMILMLLFGTINPPPPSPAQTFEVQPDVESGGGGCSC